MDVLGTGRNNMPAFSTMLSAEQIHDVGSYVSGELAKH